MTHAEKVAKQTDSHPLLVSEFQGIYLHSLA